MDISMYLWIHMDHLWTYIYIYIYIYVYIWIIYVSNLAIDYPYPLFRKSSNHVEMDGFR